jgi:DNA replication protein DnaC/TolA-binding protein
MKRFKVFLTSSEELARERKKTAVIISQQNNTWAKNELENYRQHLEQRFRYLDFTGLNAILQKPLPLENIYVKLRARESLPAARFHAIANFERLANRLKDTGEIEDEDFAALFERLYHQYQLGLRSLQMLILGKPGSGKTTLMKWIALQCLKESKPFFSQFLPVFISLRELGNDPDNTFRQKSIIILSYELTEKENISMESFFDRYFKTNRLLFLLDGLDEIGDENIRREIIEWIQNQYVGLNTLIITSILDYQDLQSLRGILGFLDLRNLRDIPGLLDLWNLRDPRSFQDLTDILHLEGLEKLRRIRELLVVFDISKLRAFLGLLELQEQQQQHYLNNFPRNYHINKTNLNTNRQEIAGWSRQAIEKLHGMPDKELLEYFPNTAEKELKQFRDIDIERIASELSRGYAGILQGKILTKERQKKIETQVTFNFKTVERILDFDPGILYDEEKHGYYIKAFEILRNKDYHQLRELMAQFAASYPDNRIRANALYILKNLL